MAKRGRPPTVGGLKMVRAALSKERSRLAGELAKIDRALAALGGSGRGPGRPPGSGKRRGRKPGPKPGRPPAKRGPGRPPKAEAQTTA